MIFVEGDDCVNIVLKNEFYKFFKNRKNLIIMALIFLYFITMNFVNMNNGIKYIEKMKTYYKNRKSQVEATLNQKMNILI